MFFTQKSGREPCVLQLFLALHAMGSAVPVQCHMRYIYATNSNNGQHFWSNFRVLSIFLFIVLEVVVKIKHNFEMQA